MVWPVSAKKGLGIEDLLLFIDKQLSKQEKKYKINLSFSDGKTLAWLYEKGAVLSCKEMQDSLELEVSLSDKDFAQIKSICSPWYRGQL